MSPPARRIAALLLAVMAVLAAAPDAHAYTYYFWTNWAGGAATTTTNWSPNGYPTAPDYANFNAPATFTTSWASPADTLSNLLVTQGNPSFSIANRLGLASSVSIYGISSLTITGGTMAAPNWYSTYSTLGNLAITGTTSEVDAGFVNWGSTNGTTSRIDVLNGGRLMIRGQLALGYSNGASFAGSIHHRVRTGFPLMLYFPVIYTMSPDGVSGGDCTIGGYGTATLDAYDGGYLNTAGNLYVGAYEGGSGVLHCYPGGGAASGVTSNGPSFIGANYIGPLKGGNGVVQLEGSSSFFNGLCTLGDGDEVLGTPVKGVLQVDNGAYTVFSGGITMNDALTGRFDVIGGNTHVIGGAVKIKQADPFLVGSAGGHSPTLWFENGLNNDFWPAAGLPALGVGRGGAGTVRAAGAGTALTLHGGLVMGDSLNGHGTLVADSAATITVQGTARLGGDGQGELDALHPGSVVDVKDSTLINLGGVSYARILADSGGVVHLEKPAVVGAGGSGLLLSYAGAAMDVAGLTLGPSYGLAETGWGGSITVSDHLDLLGTAMVAVDSGGTFLYSNAAKMASVQANAYFIVNNLGLAQIAGGLDVFGNLQLQPFNTIGLVATDTDARLSPASRRAPPARTQVGLVVPGGRLEAPLVRLRGNAAAVATGTIASRFRMDSGTTTLKVSFDDNYFTGRLVVGDSTKTDGFVSIGATTVGADTLMPLDSDGADLGKMTLAGGVLQLPKPGHLRSGFLLSGTGAVQGSLDVRDSAWVSFHGQVTGDLALAGTLDLGPPGSALLLGTLHAAPTGRTTLRVGHLSADVMIVFGTATLGGTLDLRSITGDAPQVGDTITVISAGAVSGTFATVRFNGRPAAGVATVLYRPGDVRVAITGAITAVDDGPAAGPSPPAALRFAGVGAPREAALALDLPAAASVRATLYDVTGREVATLADGELAAGRHRFELARSVGGSGMYFARAEVRDAAGTRVLTARAVVLR